VQFYREASDVQYDETGNRKRKYRYGDEDEIELEQQERRRHAQLNKEFKAYAEKMVETISASVSVCDLVDVICLNGLKHRWAKPSN
jgi:nucleosome binding factor SPN SPT16 subunit